MPGGCAFGHRPVDQHVKAFRALGVDLDEEGGNFEARRVAPLGGRYVFEMLTVGATQNAILAAVLGTGQVVLENASIDTDVVDMIGFLNSLGANIEGAGTHTLVVTGVASLRGGEYTVIPDRIEAGTLMIAAAATRSHLTLTGVRPDHMRALSMKLTEMGVSILETDDTLSVNATSGVLLPTDITTGSFPGFPTDIQPQMSALLATVPGTSVVTDGVYTDRLTHVVELHRMGANIKVSGHTQTIQGAPLHGAPVKAADIRAARRSWWPPWPPRARRPSTAWCTSTAATSASRSACGPSVRAPCSPNRSSPPPWTELFLPRDARPSAFPAGGRFLLGCRGSGCRCGHGVACS